MADRHIEPDRCFECEQLRRYAGPEQRVVLNGSSTRHHIVSSDEAGANSRQQGTSSLRRNASATGSKNKPVQRVVFHLQQSSPQSPTTSLTVYRGSSNHSGSCSTESHAGDTESQQPPLPPPPPCSMLQQRGRLMVCLFLLVIAVAAGVSVAVSFSARGRGGNHDLRLRKVAELLKSVPLIDGHNDLAWNIRQFKQNQLRTVNFSSDFLATHSHPWSKSPWSQTDLVRLKAGLVGAQFWSAYAPCGSQDYNAVQIILEQIDVIKRFIDHYPKTLALATSSSQIPQIHAEGKVASLIGVEGGHSLGNSLGVLRMLHDLGATYLSLTHSCDTPWAESDGPMRKVHVDRTGKMVGLSYFGRRVVREMNRIGMIVDLSHSSLWTMQHALEESTAPVIFSHSGAQGVCNSSRNVPDDILRLLALNEGIVMVPFYPPFVSCSSAATIRDVIRHMNHIRRVVGVDHIGIGSDFDGIDLVPSGLEDVSKYPHLLAELLAEPGWTEEDVKKVAGLNFLRVFKKVEQVGQSLRDAGTRPEELPILPTDLVGHLNCTYLGD